MPPNNRIDPTAPPSPRPSAATVDQNGQPVSPTGKPVLPPVVVPVVTAVVALASLGAQFLPGNTVASHICHSLMGFAALFGIISPGLRAKP